MFEALGIEPTRDSSKIKVAYANKYAVLAANNNEEINEALRQANSIISESSQSVLDNYLTSIAFEIFGLNREDYDAADIDKQFIAAYNKLNGEFREKYHQPEITEDERSNLDNRYGVFKYVASQIGLIASETETIQSVSDSGKEKLAEFISTIGKQVQAANRAALTKRLNTQLPMSGEITHIPAAIQSSSSSSFSSSQQQASLQAGEYARELSESSSGSKLSEENSQTASAMAAASSAPMMTNLQQGALNLIEHMLHRDDVINRFGIFRIEDTGRGRGDYFNQLINNLSNGEVTDFKELSPIACSTLLKKILRKLKDDEGPFMVNKAESANIRDNQLYLRDSLLDLLAKIDAASAINQMTANNLAKILQITISQEYSEELINELTQLVFERSLHLPRLDAPAVPEEVQLTQSNSPAPIRQSSTGFFNQASSSSQVPISGESLLTKIKAAVQEAYTNYHSYQTSSDKINSEVNRGVKPRLFSSWHHGKKGEDRAAALYDRFAKIDDEILAVKELVEFLRSPDTAYHSHSYSSYLIDSLRDKLVTESITLPQATTARRYYDNTVADVIDFALGQSSVSKP